MYSIEPATAHAAEVAIKRMDEVYAYAERVLPGSRDMDWKELRGSGLGRKVDKVLASVSKRIVCIDYAETDHDMRVAVAAAASMTFVPRHWCGSRRAMALVEGL